jgi:hypothetical protein
MLQPAALRHVALIGGQPLGACAMLVGWWQVLTPVVISRKIYKHTDINKVKDK